MPAVHLPLVDLLRTMIEAGRITQANRVRCCEHAEPAIWTDDAVLIEERHLPVCFQYALDNEHNIGTARIIFVKDQRDRMLKRPGKKAFLELRYLLSAFQDAGVLADQLDTADKNGRTSGRERVSQSERLTVD